MLTQVPINDFPKLEEIVLRNIAACNAGQRTSYTYVQATATLYASQGNAAVWADNVEDPHVLLIVSKGKFGVLNETFAFVNTAYVDKEHRTPDVLKEMVNTASLWAKANSCDTIQASSWLYRGSTDVTEVWKSEGFEEQEIILVKEV